MITSRMGFARCEFRSIWRVIPCTTSCFTGGCNGNLQAISRVVEGMTVEQIEGYFKGISCNGRGTSCSDQLATAVRKAKESE